MDQLFALWCEASPHLQRVVEIVPAEHIYAIKSLRKPLQLCPSMKESWNVNQHGS